MAVDCEKSMIFRDAHSYVFYYISIACVRPILYIQKLYFFSVAVFKIIDYADSISDIYFMVYNSVAIYRLFYYYYIYYYHYYY